MLSLLFAVAAAAPCDLPLIAATGLVVSGAPGVGQTQVPWDGGLVCDIHVNPRCPEGARVVPFNCVPRCFDVRTCAYVSPLPFPSR